MNKVDKPMDESMDKTTAIKLMSLLLSAIMGPEQFEKASAEFQMLVFSSAELVDKIEKQGMKEVLNTIDEATIEPIEPTDCEKLLIIKNQINQAYYELCETCRPADPTGPAVCDLGNFVPKETGGNQ